LGGVKFRVLPNLGFGPLGLSSLIVSFGEIFWQHAMNFLFMGRDILVIINYNNNPEQVEILANLEKMNIKGKL
jgi:hypothetical protein